MKNNFSLYGLPEKVIYCKKCVISNQRPSSTIEFKNTKNVLKKVINFDLEGICDACRVKEKKQTINWNEREKELRDLCNRFRNNNNNYDIYIGPSDNNVLFKKINLKNFDVYICLTTIPTRANNQILLKNINNFIENQNYKFKNILLTIPKNYKRFNTNISKDVIDILRKTKNTILTPHIGYVSSEAYEKFFNGYLLAIEAFLDKTVINQIN